MTEYSNAWCGDVAIARVYNDALTPAEVKTLWNDMKGGVGINSVNAGTNQQDAIYTINGIRVQKTQKSTLHHQRQDRIGEVRCKSHRTAVHESSHRGALVIAAGCTSSPGCT